MEAEKTKEQLYEEDLQRLRGFRPMDDDFMRMLFRKNLPLAQLVLRIITGIDDLIITEEETQYDLKRLVGARSLCLDVYGTDSSGKKYDLEIQRADSGARPHRARYHSSAMDVENLSANQEFEELPDTYTIFITERDIYGAGEPIYIIDRVNKTTGRDFEDGEHIIYVNGAYEGDSDIGKLMHDFRCTSADDMNYTLLAEQTRYYKENPEGVSKMCKVMEDMRNETAKRTEEQTTLMHIRSIMDSLGMTVEKAMETLKIPQSDREEYVKYFGKTSV